jgi:hypothetical protein
MRNSPFSASNWVLTAAILGVGAVVALVIGRPGTAIIGAIGAAVCGRIGLLVFRRRRSWTAMRDPGG